MVNCTYLSLSFDLHKAWRSRGRWAPPVATDCFCIRGHHVHGRAHRGGVSGARPVVAAAPAHPCGPIRVTKYIYDYMEIHVTK